MYLEKLTAGRFVSAVCAVSLTVAASAGRAATLSSVPMQGGMVMPMVSYHSSDGMMHVMMPATVPQLTPLMVSNPGDSFDSADPWFGALDPSAQGKAFSRRYGFVMDANTELLPAGTQIWIRKLSGSPGAVGVSVSGDRAEGPAADLRDGWRDQRAVLEWDDVPSGVRRATGDELFERHLRGVFAKH
jgi:hypothetical protein